MVRSIRSNRVELNSQSLATLALLKKLDDQIFFLNDDRKALVTTTDIFVLPYSPCIAYSAPASNSVDAHIVISSGFIDLVAFTIANAIFLDKLPAELSDYYLLGQRKDMPLLSLMSNISFLLSLHYYRDAAPLPNPFTFLSATDLDQASDAINGALLFTILHEIGHIQLNHHAGTVRPAAFELVLSEDASIRKKQEFEADQFAVKSMLNRPEAKIISKYWLSQSLSFFSGLELISGVRADDHPMAINRVYQAVSNAKSGSIEHHTLLDQTIHAERARRFLDTEKSLIRGSIELIRTPRIACMNILDEVNRFLELQYRMDISPYWQTSYPSWVSDEENR